MQKSARGNISSFVLLCITSVSPLLAVAQTSLPDPSVVFQSPTEIREAHLINSSTGWVLQGENLLWSDTAGRTFTDITPPLVKQQTMEKVHFYDGLNGWVAIQGPGTQPDIESSVTVAATSNGGKSWTLTPIAPDDEVFLNSYAGKADLSFVSPERGFALFTLMGSTASSGAYLFGTDDGGRTWKKIAVTDKGTIQFLTPHTGWLLGGVGDRHIYRTSDGGLTWKELHVPLPPDIKAEDPTYFSNPGPIYRVFYEDAFFSNLQNGTLEVNYVSKSSQHEIHTVGRFSTTNGGDSWQWVKPTSALPETFSKTARILDHSSSAPSLSLNGNVISFQSSSGTHQHTLPLSLPDRGTLSIQSADFSDPSHGWLVVAGDFQIGMHPRRTALLSTSDGGVTFEVLLRAYTPLKKQSEIQGTGHPAPDIGIRGSASNLGIDTCHLVKDAAHLRQYIEDARKRLRVEGPWRPRV